ncbi:MAG: matrixin family metalloprotease, partial [Acidobacteria bacterium]|nr:matrixin family metalloprotease [Acidobacteriota bacterium]
MKFSPAFRTAATAVVLAAALASGAKAYTTYSSWGTLDVPFYVNPANLDVSSSATISALQAGMRVWNEQSGTAFRFSYAGQVSTTTTGFDNKNMVVFRNERDGSKIASTYSWTTNGLLKDTDIVFWDAARTFFTGTSGCISGGAYIEDIAAHEFGHALGLQHSSVPEATMYGTYSACSKEMRTLSADDVAAAQALYADGPGEADTPPSVSILAPSNGATVSEATTITFSGSATDTTDGDISSRLTWRSNISGSIGTGASFSRTLPAGSHTITATVVDSIGFTTARAHVLTVTSAPANTAPMVTITSPANGASVTAGTSLTFAGSANDSQDGNLTSSLTWRSNLDGQIGTGGGFTRALTAGTHTITASIIDSGGLTTSRSITVSSTAPAPPPPPTPPPAPTPAPPAPTPAPPSPTPGATLTVRAYTIQAQ